MAEPARLFLDTARLGPMSPSAQLAARDFARLAGEGLSTLYFERFLTRGCTGESRSFRRKYPALAAWAGLRSVHGLLRRLAGAPAHAPILFASRGAPLFRLAAEWLARLCRNVLITDTLWSPYRAALEQTATAANIRMTVLPLRDAVWDGRLTETELLRDLVSAYARDRCDGLVLSAVSHDGVRIPIAKTLAAIAAIRPIRATVIDGAQELAHVPVDLSEDLCDFYLAGCHKWLGAYQPLAAAVLPNYRTAPSILNSICDDRPLDPLLQFLRRVEGKSVADTQDTVNVAPLLSAWGALCDFHSRPSTQEHRLYSRIKSASRLSSLLPSWGWRPFVPPAGLRTGILMARAVSRSILDLPPATLQQRIETRGVALTAYAEGLIRISLSDRRLRPAECNLLARSLAFPRYSLQKTPFPCGSAAEGV